MAFGNKKANVVSTAIIRNETLAIFHTSLGTSFIPPAPIRLLTKLLAVVDRALTGINSTT